MHSSFGIKETKQHRYCSPKLHIWSLHTTGVKTELTLGLRLAVSEIRADCEQSCLIWVWTLAISKSSRIYIYTLFLSKGWIWACFRSSGFRFSKLSFWTWNLAIRKVPEIAHTLCFYPQGVDSEHIFTRLAAISEIRPIFKNTLFGHETWPLVKTLEVAHILSFYPTGVEIEFISVLRVAVSKKWADCQNWHICSWNLAIGKRSRSCSYTHFLPHGVEIKLIFALRAMTIEIWDFWS